MYLILKPTTLPKPRIPLTTRILGTRESNAPPLRPLSPGLALGFSKSAFTYKELAIATNGFSLENLLGQVHRRILPNGKEVAIKQLKSGSGQEKSLPTMDWTTRLKVALGAARGPAYLHKDCHPRIIHRDIKVAKILLDFKFEAKAG
ncbi:hypothetical protein EJ110_NYTH31809 [Nymphaea thermarum]|nr:hypothetical protein EJ110_NYTH31809 [Nymphaea thermarum]